MAVLLEYYPGSAVSLWNNFDQHFIYTLMDETNRLRKETGNTSDKEVRYNQEEIEDKFNSVITPDKLQKLQAIRNRFIQ